MSKYDYDPGNSRLTSYKTQSDKLTARIDWNLNKNNTFTIKYNYLKSSRDIAASNSGAPGGNRQPGSTSMPFSGSGYTINNNFNIVLAELNTRFAGKSSNKLQVGFTQLRDFRASLSGKDFPLVDIMNGQGQTYTSFGYEPFTYNNLLNTDVYQLQDILPCIRGRTRSLLERRIIIRNSRTALHQTMPAHTVSTHSPIFITAPITVLPIRFFTTCSTQLQKTAPSLCLR